MNETAWGRQRLSEWNDDVYALQYQNRQFADQVDETQAVWTDTRAREFSVRVLDGYLANAQEACDSLARQSELLGQGIDRIDAAKQPETDLYNLSDETARQYQTSNRYAAEALAESNVVVTMAKEANYFSANANRILMSI